MSANDQVVQDSGAKPSPRRTRSSQMSMAFVLNPTVDPPIPAVARAATPTPSAEDDTNYVGASLTPVNKWTPVNTPQASTCKSSVTLLPPPMSVTPMRSNAKASTTIPGTLTPTDTPSRSLHVDAVAGFETAKKAIETTNDIVNTPSTPKQLVKTANMLSTPAQAVEAANIFVTPQQAVETAKMIFTPQQAVETANMTIMPQQAVETNNAPSMAQQAVEVTDTADSPMSTLSDAASTPEQFNDVDFTANTPMTAVSTPPAEDPMDVDTTIAAAPTTTLDTATATATNSVPTAEFTCMNDEYEPCRTGQVTLDLSRKVISDHFGRNKSCTRLISSWPLFCRKHYQRATYNQKLWQVRKIALILRQFAIIEREFPGTAYTVTLKKSEEQRLNTFSRKVAAGMDADEAAELVKPKGSKHFEAPVNVLREIEQLDYLGEGKTRAEVEAAVNTIKDMLESEDTQQVPSIEFLPELARPAAEVEEDLDVDMGEAKPKKAGAKTRVSAKGGIKKPAAKGAAKGAANGGVKKPAAKGSAAAAKKGTKA